MRWESKTKRPRTKKTTTQRKGSLASGGSVRQYPFLRRFYQHQSTISDGLQKFLFFLVLAALLYVFVLGDGGAIRIISLKNQKAALAKDVALVRVNIEQLQSEIDLLQSDPFIMEKLGRERYGYVYPGEQVYKMVPDVDSK